MKRTICLILSFVISFSSICLTCSSCTKDKPTSQTSGTSEDSDTVSSTDETFVDFELTENYDIDDIPTLTKYRSIYCDIPRPFSNLVDLYEFQDWYGEIIKNDPNETNIMVMKLFIQEFNISRENFDKANLEWTKIIITGFKGQPVMDPQDFANQEINEVYNADIIYTFDDEIINSYYLSHEYPYLYELEFETAVENGTYVSQTEVWVDVDAMEAEIIEKYGETEIVTEDTTVIQEEITG